MLTYDPGQKPVSMRAGILDRSVRQNV
eukprot:COSAG04_NODE_13740_length_594_cov_0.583838_2_plen_26_part_01